MKILDLTLNDPAADVALDEALLEQAESGEADTEVLRLWQPENPVVVLGRSSPIDQEVSQEYCLREKIPIVRRCSGGAAILTGRGCLMYAVLLDCRRRSDLKAIDRAHGFVMKMIQESVANCGVDCRVQGICDLTIGDRKVSGNAMRCRKNWLLYHGTLICEGMDLNLISECLGPPQRQPGYRRRRCHSDFLTRIPVDANAMSRSLCETWRCDDFLLQWPQARTHCLVEEKYSKNSWTTRMDTEK